MTTRPLLEIYVVWHPADHLGAQAAEHLYEHFHGPSYDGLAGGAVEVYMRSAEWKGRGSPPRPTPVHEPLPGRLPSAEFTVIVPVLSRRMAEAAEESPEWMQYLGRIVTSGTEEGVLVLPIRHRDDIHLTRAEPSALFDSMQHIFASDDLKHLSLEVAQATTEHLLRNSDPITVFISHTKKTSTAEGQEIFERVLGTINRTRLSSFFDARDIRPGDEDYRRALDDAAGNCALLMVRTDMYARREWTQREVLMAKRAGTPVVTLHALRSGEDRGSFLMDHVPVVPYDHHEPESGILQALQRLVDEVLKQALWRHQHVYVKEHGFDWLPTHAPEAVTLADFLRQPVNDPNREKLWVLHPDPPLGPQEHEVVVGLCELAGRRVEVLTPRTFAARGGRLST